MKSVAQKILISIGFMTLIVLSVMPVFVYAQDISAMVASAVGDALINAASPLLFLVMRTVSGLLGLAGLLLDAVIKITVVDMAENIKNLSAINDVWGKIRDLGNMSFIFILLYHGLRMVLGLGGADIKKVITGIIIAAIFVNFSLLVTKVVIDASNIVTLGFYNSISSAGGATSVSGQTYNFGFSGAFMKPLGLSGIWDTEGFKTLVGTKRDASSLVIYIGGTIFMLIALFVFLTVALLFVIRYMVFIVLLIMSPIAFLTFAVPGLGSLSKKYWDTLFGQALFGPIYMLMTWVTLSIAGSDGFLNNKNSFGTALADPNPDTVSVIINFVILIGLLIYSVVLAKTHATTGGIASAKYLEKGQAYLGGAVFGGASYLGRSTLGRYGQSVSEDKDLKERAARGDVGARLKLLAGNKLASSSFDARNTKTMEMATGDIGGLGKIGSFGKGINTKGYRGYVDDKLKAQGEADKKRAEQFKVSEDKASLEEYEKQLKDDPSIETNKRDARKIILDTLIAEEKGKVKTQVAKIQPVIDKLTEGKLEFEAKKTKSEKEIRDLKNLINSASNSLTDNSDLVAQYESQLRDEESKLIVLTGGLNDTNTLLQEKKKELNEINSEVLKLQAEAREIDQDIWISPEYEKIIADAGGRKEEKNKNTKAITKKGVASTSDTNILAYAERVKNKTGLFSGVPNFTIDRNYSKRRADAVRKLTRQENNTQRMEKIIKEMAKEQEKEEESTKNTPAPAAPAATPPPPPVNP